MRETPGSGYKASPPKNDADYRCTYKRRYVSRARAKKALRKTHSTQKTMNVYKCCYCDGWHLGNTYG